METAKKQSPTMLSRTRVRRKKLKSRPLQPTPFQETLQPTPLHEERTIYFFVAPHVDTREGVSGGVGVIRHIVHVLNCIGARAVLLAGNTKRIRDDDVVVYTETVTGNPCRARNVIRWMLMMPTDSQVASYASTDVILDYLSGYRELAPLLLGRDALAPPPHGMLTCIQIPPFIPDVHLIRPPHERSDVVCVLQRKGGLKFKPRLRFDQQEPHMAWEALADLLPRPSRDARSIPSTAWEELAKPPAYAIASIEGKTHSQCVAALSDCKYLLTWDPFTFTTLIACLCGALPVIVPIEGLGAEAYRAAFPIQRFGVAYGFEEAELEHARATMSRVKEVLAEYEMLAHRHALDLVTSVNETWFPAP